MVGLIVTRHAYERPAEEAAGVLGHVAELTATIGNAGDTLADETLTRFWVRGLNGDDIDRELRLVHTPAPPARRRGRGHRALGREEPQRPIRDHRDR
jgi:hypothetical protein